MISFANINKQYGKQLAMNGVKLRLTRDALQALAEDKETTVIASYLESIKDGNKFLRIAEEAAAASPVTPSTCSLPG